MKTLDVAVIFSTIWAVAYILFAYLVSQRSNLYGKLSNLLAAYGLISCAWELLVVVDHLGWGRFLGQSFWNWERVWGSLVLWLFFLACTMEFYQNRQQRWVWLGLGFFWSSTMLVIIISSPQFSGLPDIGPATLLFAGFLVGWLLMVGRAGMLTLTAYSQARQPLHKNRIIFWGVSILVTMLGDIFLFSGLEAAGSALRLLGIITAGYVVLIHDIVDLLWTFQRLLGFILKSMVAFVVYAVVLMLELPVYDSAAPVYFPFEWPAKALILVLLVNPVLALFNLIIDRHFYGSGYDKTSVVREYSLSVGNIVNLQRLSEVALGQISRALHIRNGCLFLVDRLEAENSYALWPVVLTEEEPTEQVPIYKLDGESPIVAHFLRTRRPLTQYDVDFSPDFVGVSPSEREWVTHQQVDVYVPICLQDTWIGMFALGLKMTGERYYQEDLDLLSTLADQTVVALQNARLFQDMTRLNEDLQLAKRELETANQKLRELDELKSAFIGVVTHELRTPLANIAFALQVFEMYGKENLTPEQKEQVTQLSGGIRSARSMVDNLVSYASFLNQQVQLRPERLDFREVLRDTLVSLKQYADDKGLKFHLSLVGDQFSLIGDRKYLVDTVHHLVHNAIKFTKTGDIWVSCWTSTDALCFDVQDTGIGIPADKLSTVWNAFTQASTDSLLRGVEGLGLGLALVKLIVAAHGGNVWAESKENQGSVFGFEIPLAGPGKPLGASRARSLQRDSPAKNPVP